MTELTPWPYEKFPSAYEVTHGSTRYVVQYTEDGHYGFAFIGDKKIANMIGPHETVTACLRELRKVA